MDQANKPPLDPENAHGNTAAYSSLGSNLQGGPQKNPENHNPTKVQEVTTESDFSSQVSSLPSSTLAVIYFHAPWAAPCKQMSAILEALASTYPADNPPKAIFLSINAEEVPEVAEKFDVESVPYLVLQKDGQTVDTVSGSDAAKVRAAVEKHAGKSGDPGKIGLPPPQTVSRSAEDDKPSNGVKNLSSYAPSASDPTTAPEYSSGQKAGDKDALFKRLDELVKAAPVMLFMKGTPSQPQCGFSRQTVQLLRDRSIRYGFFNILADDEVRQGLKEYADWPTFPQLWADGELVGGLDIVREEFDNDPDFLSQHSVGQNKAGGMAGAEAQA